MAKEDLYTWTDNPTESGIAECDTDKLNDCLMHLKYDKKDGGSGFNLFDTKLSDHILEGEEAFGWGLQGTYTLSSYTDFYQKCLAEKTAGVATQTTLGESTITTYNNANGHIFYDIADKAVVDAYYNQTGYAWFYGIDTENERIFLPRNKWLGIKNVANTLPVRGNGMSLGFTDGTENVGLSSYSTVNAIYQKSSYGANIGSTHTISNPSFANYKTVGVTSDASKSGLVANSADILTLDDSKYLYICIGNTVVNQADVDVANLTGDMQNKADTDADNFTNAGKSLLAGLAMPSDKYVDLTLGATGTVYTAPANGYVSIKHSADISITQMINDTTDGICSWLVNNGGTATYIPVRKGSKFKVSYVPGNLYYFRFIYAEGAKND